MNQQKYNEFFASVLIRLHAVNDEAAQTTTPGEMSHRWERVEEALTAAVAWIRTNPASVNRRWFARSLLAVMQLGWGDYWHVRAGSVRWVNPVLHGTWTDEVLEVSGARIEDVGVEGFVDWNPDALGLTADLDTIRVIDDD